jgi:hypothetical protein
MKTVAIAMIATQISLDLLKSLPTYVEPVKPVSEVLLSAAAPQPKKILNRGDAEAQRRKGGEEFRGGRTCGHRFSLFSFFFSASLRLSISAVQNLSAKTRNLATSLQTRIFRRTIRLFGVPQNRLGLCNPLMMPGCHVDSIVASVAGC